MKIIIEADPGEGGVAIAEIVKSAIEEALWTVTGMKSTDVIVKCPSRTVEIHVQQGVQRDHFVRSPCYPLST